MYKFLTLKKEEEILILHMMLGASNRIYWALTTPENKEIVEDFGLKELEGKVDEFKCFYANKEQIQRIFDEICELELNQFDIDINFTNFHQFVRCLLENKSVSEILKENE